MTIIEFKDLLKTQVVKFKFEKQDGTIRTANGTLKANLIPTQPTKSIKGRTVPEDMVVYYDLDKNGFRSFHFSQFIDCIK